MTKTQIALFTGVLLAANVALADGGSVKGSIAYTPEMTWDYNKDNKSERVQYWVDIDAETDGDQVKGEVVKYLKNLDSGEKIYQFANMQMTGTNSLAPEEVTALSIDGDTARLTFGDITYTIRDSAAYDEGEARTFLSDNGVNEKEYPILAGSVTVAAR